MLFRRPVRAGDMLEIRSRVAHLGTKNITVHTECKRRKGEDLALVSTFVTFQVRSRSTPPTGSDGTCIRAWCGRSGFSAV